MHPPLPQLPEASQPAAFHAASRRIQLALIDDDADLRAAITTSVQYAPDIRIAAIVASHAEGLLLLEQAQADVLVVALNLPDGQGVDIIRRARRAWPGCGIMVGTAVGERADLIECIEAGAAGYLFRDSAPDQMLDEIRSIGNGGGSIMPLLAHRILMRARHGGPVLSSYEARALELVARGFTVDEVARRMDLSRQIVLSFVRSIYGRLARS